MKNVRIYKDDIRTHILRSLFFTDTAIMLIGTILLGGILYVLFTYVFHYFNWSYYLSALFVSVIFFITIVTQRVDNQPIYQIVPRLLKLKTHKREQRTSKIDSYFINFQIQDDLIVRKDSLVRVYEIEPYDIALLNEQDRSHFFIKLKQAINTIPDQIQIIVKKDRALSSDYSQHVFSLYDSSASERENLIQKYIEELTRLIDNNKFTITRCYAVISVACQTKNLHSKESAIRKLNDIGTNFSAHLSNCNITTKSLTNEKLINFLKGQLR